MKRVRRFTGSNGTIDYDALSGIAQITAKGVAGGVPGKDVVQVVATQVIIMIEWEEPSPAVGDAVSWEYSQYRVIGINGEWLWIIPLATADTHTGSGQLVHQSKVGKADG